MKTWKVAAADLRCGGCRTTIAKGHLFLEYAITPVRRLVRCQRCGESMTGEPAPDALEAETPAPPPLEVRHQPSLGLEPVGKVSQRSPLRSRFRR